MSSPEPPNDRRAPDAPLGALVADLSVQIPELVRSELRLAQAELAEKGKRAGIGVGLFGAAGLLALFLAVVLFAAAGVTALRGKSQVAEATPAKPERVVAGIKEDIETVKGHHA